jgi:hypothetical protein
MPQLVVKNLRGAGLVPTDWVSFRKQVAKVAKVGPDIVDIVIDLGVYLHRQPTSNIWIFQEMIVKFMGRQESTSSVNGVSKVILTTHLGKIRSQSFPNMFLRI